MPVPECAARSPELPTRSAHPPRLGLMIRLGMSTSCVYPLSPEHAFRIARLAGLDGLEVMVTNDPVTQDPDALNALSERFGLPILSIHAPVLLLTTFVWG